MALLGVVVVGTGGCKNGNDCSLLARLFYGRGRIKRHHHANNFIAELFYGRG